MRIAANILLKVVEESQYLRAGTAFKTHSKGSRHYMALLEHTITVNIPLNVVYRQWADFETYPYFMKYVKSVQRLSEVRHIWLGEVGGEDREWYTEITQQIPNQLIAWQTTSGGDHRVLLRFFRVDDDTTRIVFQADFGPEGPVGPEAASQVMAFNLDQFKAKIEDDSYNENVWRGAVAESVAALWNEKPAFSPAYRRKGPNTNRTQE